jgi:hypothetical protein
MSVYTLVFSGVTPLGALWAGEVSEALGPGLCMVLSGSIGLAAVAALLLSRRGKGGGKAAQPPSA